MDDSHAGNQQPLLHCIVLETPKEEALAGVVSVKRKTPPLPLAGTARCIWCSAW